MQIGEECFCKQDIIPFALPVARNSKKNAVSIKSHPIKTPVCILFLMHTAIVSKHSAKPNSYNPFDMNCLEVFQAGTLNRST